jgi:hypothetical protein
MTVISCLPFGQTKLPQRFASRSLFCKKHSLQLWRVVARESSATPDRQGFYGLDGTTKEGHFNAIYGNDGDRDEFNFGDYHGIRLSYQGKMLQNTYQSYPPELSEVDHLIPLHIGRFDQSDTTASRML